MDKNMLQHIFLYMVRMLLARKWFNQFFMVLKFIIIFDVRSFMARK